MEIIILIISSFITSAISAVIGMGGGIILLGIMALIIPDGFLVIALHGVIQLFSNTTRVFIFRKYLKGVLIKEFFFGALFGLSISVIIIMILIYFFNVKTANQIEIDILKPGIGLFIIWYLYLKPSKKIVRIGSFKKVGLISGLFSIFVGATGPLIAPFFLEKDLTKENIISNKAACQVISHLGKIPIFIFLFDLNYLNEYRLLTPLIISVYLGTYFGKKILSNIKESVFHILFKIALTIIAIKLLIENILAVNLF